MHLDGWLALGKTEPVGLVSTWGWMPALAATLVALALVGWGVRRWAGNAHPLWRTLGGGRHRAGAAGHGQLRCSAGQPWGVVYGFGLWAAKIAQGAGAFDPSANWFWSQPGNAQRMHANRAAGRDQHHQHRHPGPVRCGWPARNRNQQAPTGQQWLVGMAAGLLLGYSSRLAFGCNVGAMLSGIATGSIHGWIWVPLAFGGTLIGLRVRRHFQF